MIRCCEYLVKDRRIETVIFKTLITDLTMRGLGRFVLKTGGANSIKVNALSSLEAICIHESGNLMQKGNINMSLKFGIFIVVIYRNYLILIFSHVHQIRTLILFE